MASLSTLTLPPRGDRRVRIAYVVLNDTYGDTRVLKIAETARQAGADVRIFALGGRGHRFPAGLERRDNGVEIERVELFSFDRMLLGGGIWLRKVLRKPVPVYVDPRTLPAAEAKQALDRVRESQPTGAVGVGKRAIKGGFSLINRWLIPMSFRVKTKRRIGSWCPDLIHAHDANTLAVGGGTARRLGIPFVYDSHELWTHRNVAGRSARRRRRERSEERRWARLAARVTTVSPSIVRWLQKNYGLTPEPGLVRNIPPFTGALPEREKGRLRELAGLQPGDKVVVYCGAITSNRGVESGIDALPALPGDTHLVLLGHGSDLFRTEMYERALALGVESRVHFVGAVPSAEVSTTLADADVSLVLTRPTCLSYEYSLPNKLFESIHAGIPVLSTRLVDVAALVDQYHVGATVSVDAPPAELAERIGDVIARGDEFRRGAARAATELSWSKEADILLGIYAGVLGLESAHTLTGTAV